MYKFGQEKFHVIAIESENLLNITIEKFRNNFTNYQLSSIMVLDFIFRYAGKLFSKKK